MVLIDKQYLDVDVLLNKIAFGEYLKEEYDANALWDAEGFGILRK